ncbi:hypothetical protein ACQP25_40100 [Microtetraspora malaysiensis]|uniref:hypothetical protein n=1 Tax=Microtetraspora malaysiensis TaxID=161358 RepID=UPI003D8EE9C5
MIGRAIAWRHYVIFTIYAVSVKPGVNGMELRVGYPKIAAGRGVSGDIARVPYGPMLAVGGGIGTPAGLMPITASRCHASARPWRRSHLLGDIL